MKLDATVILTGDQSKKTVISTLINHFCAASPHIDPNALFDQFWQRELMGSTGLGYGVAIPHIRTEQVKETHAVFVRLERPIDFAGIDKQPVDLVMGMLFSDKDQHRNLVELKHVAEFFNACKNRQFIRDAEQTVTIEFLLKNLVSKHNIPDLAHC
ncbi:PTS sugar transporter subunit IIA [Legionella sp. W05-934-2]|uniref:PTS sugar transporter subunit IIA n=1 Tax=Legionella sp. W05-934-2 TaxID=1198649 RepID=UPI0034636174